MNRLTIILLSVFLASCATVAPVVNPNETISIYGVSSLPPQNGNWNVITVSGYQMSLAKNGSRKNESLAVNVSIFQLPEFPTDKEFLDYVVQGRAAEPSIGRFEVLTNSESLETLNGANCVKYHSISKDQRAQIQGGETAVMLLENRGYNCKHPKNDSVGVNVEYSLRHFPETEYLFFDKNSNEFASNIEFTEF